MRSLGILKIFTNPTPYTLPKQARYQLRYTSMNGAVVREIPHWDRPFSARIL